MKLNKLLISILVLSFFWTGSANAKTQIEWLQWFAAENTRDFYEGLVDEFEASNPNISVKLVTQPFGKVREV